jgi:hypothetical protein
MQTQRLLVSLVLLLCGASCGSRVNQGVKRSLLGVSNQQLLIDAQHVMAREGLEIESIDVKRGEIASTWQTKNRKQIQYVVKIEGSATAHMPAANQTDTDNVGDTEPVEPVLSPTSITVSVKVKEKTVKGWSEPVPGQDGKAADLADDIIALSVDRFEHGRPAASLAEPEETPEEKAPECENTAGCGAGLHCAMGACVSECDATHPCLEEDRECDVRGRCVLKPEPCPTLPAATGSVDAELPYDMQNEKAAESDEEAAKRERRRRRREREREREQQEEGRVSDEK